MDFPSFNHRQHHHRYVPPSPKYSDGHPNLYPHHLPPPPLLPPPHPPSYPSLPQPRLPRPPLPPASYNPHQSHFPFLSQNPPFFIDHRSSPTPPRFSDQPHRFNYRPDSWSDQPRILPELLQQDRILQDDDLHRRPFSPYRLSESYYKPHDLECVNPASRYRDDIFIDGYASRGSSNIVKQEQQLLSHAARNNNDGNDKYYRHHHDLDRYESANPETISNNLEFSCSSSRNQKDFVDNFEVHYTSMLDNERSRGSHRDKDPRWVHGIEGEKNEFVRGGVAGVSFGSARGEPRGYEYELGKFNREREGREEFKQVQKKSVLLRIGKPKNSLRNRSHDQNFSKAYLDESNNSIFRGKDKYKDHSNKDSSLYKDQKLEEDRERSPVDLDVSFISNALVAKAVMTPSSPAFDNSSTPPRNRKIRRATEFDSPVAKFREHSTRSGSSSRGSECPSSTEKAPRKPREQGFPSAVNDSARDSMDESLSGIVLDQGGRTGGSDGPLSFKLTKKRKVINLDSPASTYHSTKKDDERLFGESSGSPSTPNRPAISFPSLEESIAGEGNGSPQSMVAKKDGSEPDTVRPCQLDNERNVFPLSSPLAHKTDPSLHDIGSFVLESDADKTPTEPKVSTVCNDLNCQSSENEVGNDTVKGSTDDKVSLRGSDTSVSTRQKSMEESYAAVNTTNTCFSSCNVSTKKQETITISDTSSLVPCLNETITVFPENDAVQGSLKDVSTKEEGAKLVEGTSLAPNSCFTTTQVKKIVSESCDAADTTNPLCVDAVSISCGDGLDGSSNAVTLPGANPSVGCVKSYSSDAKRKRESSETQFGLSSPSKTPKNVVIDGHATPSSSFKKSSFHEDKVTEVGKLLSTMVQTAGPDNRNPSIYEDGFLLQTDDIQPSSIISVCADGNDASNDMQVEPLPDMISDVVSFQKVSSLSGSSMLTSNSTDQVIASQDNPKNVGNVCEKSSFKGDASTPSVEMSHPKVTGHVASSKNAPSASKSSNVKAQSLNRGPNVTMKQPIASNVPRILGGRSSSVFTSSSINSPAKHIAKPRTWHRSTSNPASPPLAVSKPSSIPVPPPSKSVGMGQNSYIRSGNSLVRKTAPAVAMSNGSPASWSSVSPLNPSGTNETRNSAGSGSQVHNTYSRTGGSSAPVVRPKTPPLSGSTKLLDCSAEYSGDLPCSSLEHLPMNAEETEATLEGNFTTPEATEYSDDQTGKPSNLKNQKTLDEETAGKQMQYVKRKSNQLVAASSTNQSVQDLGKTQASSADGYYKRRKNQLIRTSVGDDSASTEVQKALKINIKRQAVNGTSKKYKHSSLSSVWTLDSQPSRKNRVTLRHKLIPHLFPWKRASYWADLMHGSASVPRNNSSSLISRKLLVSRKREMIYKRSSHGLSLRMSKLLSVGGASLKWSKSIERNSKKANEEATLAVAAAEKKKREQHGTVAATTEIKRGANMSSKSIHNTKLLPEDRIFRIGLVRYKMDPSKRSLQRISDEELSTSKQSRKETKRSYVPKRLLIGHEEYVRVGNGNQLVRNPKRRTRIFANEKVRWSLHTARSRLARKRKYCQFFTRFGRCDKEDGKCPYIHDSSKIAVCTKFLNGSCSNPDCKLTHKVIPERMQDCSYFLQGLCSNECCPYRHVNVNAAASVCEGFLKGYCSDGNECRKKHTYTCPVFEASGVCLRGSKCKLHHPKNRNKGLKRKHRQSMEPHQKNDRGRYFGLTRAAVCPMPVSEKPCSNNDSDIFSEDGRFAEYIGLDFCDEEVGDTREQRTMSGGDPFDSGAAEFEELMKPIGIINRSRVAEPGLGFDSASEPTASSRSADKTDC